MTMELHKLRARELMKTEIQWASANDNLRTAGERMAQHGLRALLVRGDDPADLPGIITNKDIVNLLGSHDPAVLDQLRVGDVMTRPAICVAPQANVRDCINLMRMSGIRRMPVVDGTDVVGVISTSDIFARAMLRD
jgi:CBS domain-containing protein